MSLPDKNSYNNLGGELQDYAPVTDPTTDLSAEASNEMRCDVAAMTRTAIRGYVSFSVTGTTIVVQNSGFDAVYGNALTYKPTGLWIDTGIYTITLPASVTDARGVERDINLRAAWCNVDVPNLNGWFCSSQVVSPNEIMVYNWSMVDAALQDLGSLYTITVFFM